MNKSTRDAISAMMRDQLTLITRDQALACGATGSALRHLVDHGTWVEASPGVFTFDGTALSPRQQVLALVLSCGDEAAASHSTAAALRPIPGFVLDPELVHITVPYGRSPRAVGTAAIVHHTRAFPAEHREIIDSIPVTTVARTVFDLARITPPAKLERALDSALAARVVTLEQLRSTYLSLAGPGRSGVVLMRSLLEARGDGFVAPRSRLESRFLDIVRRFGLPEPRREVDHGSGNAWNGRVEFTFDPAVLVEVDGRRWHTALTDIEHDHDRDNEFTATGRSVLRFRYTALVTQPERVARQISDAIASQRRLRSDRAG